MNLYNYIAAIFTISEVLLLIARRSKNKAAKNRNDGRSLLLLWIAITVSLGIGYYFAIAYPLFPINYRICTITGLVVIAVGFIIRWTAIIQLGKMFTVDVAIVDNHQLNTSGIYQVVRHPSYLGLIMIIYGLSFLMSNLLSIVIVIVPVFIALNYRITVEEKTLTAEFGGQYEIYKSKVKKLIPFIY